MTTRELIYDVSFTHTQIHEPYLDIPTGTIVLPEYYENVKVVSSSRKHVSFTCEDTFLKEVGAEPHKILVTLSTLVSKVLR